MTKYKIFILGLFIFVFLVSGVLATSQNNYRVAYQIRPANQINMQIPHFTSCDCNSGDCGMKCKSGDTSSEQIKLTNVQSCTNNCWGNGAADIDVFNYAGIDRAKITIRVNNLMSQEIYTVWLMDSGNSTLYLGQFITNRAGRSIFVTHQQMVDFTVFKQLIVMRGNVTVFRDAINSVCPNNDSDWNSEWDN